MSEFGEAGKTLGGIALCKVAELKNGIGR